MEQRGGWEGWRREGSGVGQGVRGRREKSINI